MYIFAIYIGGDARNSHIELHDMRFVVAERIEDTYETLRAEWWGLPRSLHLDAWSALTQADGYKVMLKREPFKGEEKLYFLNLGGYDYNEFSEVHKNVFVVAKTAADAKTRAMKAIRNWKLPHKDGIFEVEKSFCLNETAQKEKLYNSP
jgi:hypothetical protein